MLPVEIYFVEFLKQGRYRKLLCEIRFCAGKIHEPALSGRSAAFLWPFAMLLRRIIREMFERDVIGLK